MMMDKVSNSDGKTTAVQAAFAGALSGAFTRAVAQPLDVLKIRFQLQVEPIGKGSKYSSVTQAIGLIIKEEGISTLWSGHVPAQILSVIHGTVQFSTYETLTELSQTADPEFYKLNKPMAIFCNGAVAATLATVLTFPLDTIRTRLIAEEKTHKAYSGFTNAVFSIIKKEGPKALYKGLIPTLAQIAPHTGVQFAVYKLLNEQLLNKVKFFQRPMTAKVETTMFANILSGCVAGLVAKTSIYPFDLVKKRLQIQGFQEHRKSFGRQMYCNNSLHCIKLVINNEGFLSLYKGYWPSMLKAALVTALNFSVYDEIKHFFTNPKR